MYEKLEQCPSCGHPKFHNYLICNDHSVSGESFALVRCDNCQLVFTNPRPSPSELPKYYESSAYISHTDTSDSLLHFVYRLVRKYTISKKVILVRKLRSPGTILDLGCGTGDFLKACRKSGWTVKGIEPNEQARTIASNKNQISIEQDILDLKKKEKFDVITAWHVLEHVVDLKETLKQLKKRLEKGGFLIIAVPNIDSHDFMHYKEYWAGLDVPRHLYHFSPKSFLTLAKKMKLNLVDTKPMKFDAFYVSLLSERYKSGKMNPISAFLQGYQSNKAAKSTGNYSSLIYILTK